jgi:DNA-binding winged helix-turn-helix (wHTH) protein
MPTAQPQAKFQFGDFELDTGAYELRRAGKSIRLERQPMDLLILLVEHGSQLVTRGDIVNRLWGDGVFVDVEMGINTAIRKIRHALQDSPSSSTFIETVPGKGYRFMVKVETGSDREADAG